MGIDGRSRFGFDPYRLPGDRLTAEPDASPMTGSQSEQRQAGLPLGWREIRIDRRQVFVREGQVEGSVISFRWTADAALG